MTVDVSSKSLISFALAAVADGTNAAGTNPLPTYAAACAGASKFSAIVNNWKPTGTATAITAGNCVIANGVNSEVTGATDANIGATSMAAGLAFD